MCCNLSLLCILVIIWQPTSCFYNLCHAPQNTILSDEECSELYFEPSEKSTSLGDVRLELEDNTLRIIPEASSWSNTFLRISEDANQTNQLCSKLTKEGPSKQYCFTFISEAENETFLLEYKIENLPEISSRKFLFSLPSHKEIPLFLYIDETDTSRLVLKAHKIQTSINTTYYKVEAYKEKNGNTNLQDFKLFSSYDDINYELFTYNDVGYYYFMVWIMNPECVESLCLRLTTPKVFIGRRSTRVVIGIVGASFILPFVLFLFHILTKKYAPEEQSASEERIVLTYKSSSKKHNEVVFALAALLGKMGKRNKIDIDVVDLSKNTKKSCTDSLLAANRVIYVAPPKHDSNPISIDKSLSEREFIGVIFDHCVDKLPHFFASNKIFKLFDDFDKFIRVLHISGPCNTVLYQDLRRKTEEAKIETERSLNADNLPKIIITVSTESEPQEGDSLISGKVEL